MARESSVRRKVESRYTAKKTRSFGKKGVIISVLAVAAAAVIGVTVFSLKGRDDVSAADIQAGVSYIQALEKKDVSEVENAVKKIQKAARKAALESGEIDIWAQFGDTAILGDSRAVGFYTYEFLEQRRVLAGAGHTIRNITDNIPALQSLNPSNIILAYGLNDISIGLWPTSEDYIAELDEIIGKLNESVPNAKVFVNSTIPAIDPAFQKSTKWYDIPDWNVAVKQYCADNGVAYIDISETVEAHSDLYDIDGIHMQRNFYNYWAMDMIMEISENE